MSKIKVMSESLSNKIAAGEVVERTSSVVKELVENSVDAGSTMIEVSLKNAGKDEIKVKDNGCGMDKEDAKNCFLPHATSKIKNENDLYFINTLGFRGEALPSIASVSEVTLETNNGSESTKVEVKGGEIISISDASLNKGTTFTVKNLFFNTPARLKFMKSFYTEQGNVVSLMEKLALSHPEISFTLKSDDKEILKTTGSADLLKTIHEIYGYQVSKNMEYIKGENLDYEIEGYVSNINVIKSTKKDMITMVNGRIVNNQYLNKVIKEAYHTFLMIDKYPITIININTDPTIIDVNIHPTKQDIKFSKMDTLEELLFSLIRDKLNNIENIKVAIDRDEEDYKYDLNEGLVLNDKINETIVKEEKKIEEQTLNFYVSEEKEMYEVTTKEEESPSLIKPVGLAFGTYLFAQDTENVYMIDIHAANERINYEKYLKELKELNVTTIDLLFPITIEFTKADYDKLLLKDELIKSLGFVYEQFGTNTIRITSHPTWLLEGYEEESIRRIFDLIVSLDKDFDRVKFNEQLAINLACKMSVKANTNIGPLEEEILLKRLFKCSFPYTCPHGRPTIIKYSLYDMEKLFKRKVSE